MAKARAREKAKARARAGARATAMARAHMQRSFEQWDFMGTGTISDADMGDDKNIQFF